MNKTDIHDRLVLTDGIERVVIINPSDVRDLDFDDGREDLLQCIKLAELADGDEVEFRIGNMSRCERKVIVELWPMYYIAVEVTIKHPICKSLRRMLKRLGRRHGGLEVESPPCHSEEQPAASSSVDPVF